MDSPTGIEWTFPLQLRAMLAASASYRTWIGAGDVTAASNATGFYVEYAPTPRATGDRYGFVSSNQKLSGVRASTGAGLEAFTLSALTAAWGLEWRVEAVSTENTIAFLNAASAILAEILDQADARNVVSFERWDTAQHPLTRMDGDSARYQIAYTLTARQGE